MSRFSWHRRARATWTLMAALLGALAGGAASAGQSSSQATTVSAPPPNQAPPAPAATQAQGDSDDAPPPAPTTLPSPLPLAATRPSPKEPSAMTLAILDFDSKDPFSPLLGRQTRQLLVAILQGETDLDPSDSPALADAVFAVAPGFTGLIDNAQAMRIGQEAGVQAVITGRVFVIPPRLFIAAKIIGVRTGWVEAVLVKADSTEQAERLVMQLADDLAARLRAQREQITGTTAPHPIGERAAGLAVDAKPTVAAVWTQSPQAWDSPPPVEIQMQRMLAQYGLTVKDVVDPAMRRRARQTVQEPASLRPVEWPGVDVLIVGEVASDAPVRIGCLTSSQARGRIWAVQLPTGRRILADELTARHVAASEQQAQRLAIEKTGRALCLRLLDELAKTPPESPRP